MVEITFDLDKFYPMYFFCQTFKNLLLWKVVPWNSLIFFSLKKLFPETISSPSPYKEHDWATIWFPHLVNLYFLRASNLKKLLKCFFFSFILFMEKEIWKKDWTLNLLVEGGYFNIINKIWKHFSYWTLSCNHIETNDAFCI